MGFFRRLVGLEPTKGRAAEYRRLAFTAEEIARGDYKPFFGGRAAEWTERGVFQLDFMKELGLTPSSSLLDVGCGPLRAGVHFIRFLDAGKYAGFDTNRSLIDAAKHVVADEGLTAKAPLLLHIKDFDVRKLSGRTFDFVLAFSVIEHCTAKERRLFLDRIGAATSPGGLVVATHVGWLQASDLDGTGLELQPATIDTERQGLKKLRVMRRKS